MAKWAFGHGEKGLPVWSLFTDGSEAELSRAIDAARGSGESANDDVTVVRLAIREAAKRRERDPTPALTGR